MAEGKLIQKKIFDISLCIFQIPDGNVGVSNQALSVGRIDPTASGLAYLWETNPVLKTEALPLYGDDVHHLPGAPWCINLIDGF